jgi:hypothetical protein
MHTLDAPTAHNPFAGAVSLLPTPTETYRGPALLPEEFQAEPVPTDEFLAETCVHAQQRRAWQLGLGLTGLILGAAAAILA